MLGVQLAGLADGTPPGVEEALDLVAGFDDGLVHGVPASARGMPGR